MTGQEIRDMDLTYNLHSWSKQKGLKPLVITKAEGIYLWDSDGKRYMDMALRLKYVDIPATPVEDIHHAISHALHELGSTKLYILVNYTALYPTSQYLHELERKSA